MQIPVGGRAVAVVSTHGPNRVHRAPHALGSRVVRPLPAVPPPARRAAGRAAAAPRGRPLLSPLPARRPAGGGRRLPRGPTGRGAAPHPPQPLGPAGDGAVVHAPRRVPRLRRDAGAQPATRAEPGGHARRRDGRGLPAGHVRPRRPDAPDPAIVRVRARGGVAGRSRRRRPQCVHLDRPRRQQRAGRVPARGLWQRRPSPGPGRGPAATHRRLRRDPRGRPRRAGPVDERVRPRRAPPLAGAGRGRGQRPPGRLRPGRSTALGAPGRGPDGGPPPVAGRAAVRGPGQPVDGRRLQPGRRQAGGREVRTHARTGDGAPQRVVPTGVVMAGGPARHRLAGGHPQLRPRFDLRLLGRQRRADRAAALRGGHRDRHRARRAGPGGDRRPGRGPGRDPRQPRPPHPLRPRRARAPGGRATPPTCSCSARHRRWWCSTRSGWRRRPRSSTASSTSTRS